MEVGTPIFLFAAEYKKSGDAEPRTFPYCVTFVSLNPIHKSEKRDVARWKLGGVKRNVVFPVGKSFPKLLIQSRSPYSRVFSTTTYPGEDCPYHLFICW